LAMSAFLSVLSLAATWRRSGPVFIRPRKRA
jgi:hypothetical protein